MDIRKSESFLISSARRHGGAALLSAIFAVAVLIPSESHASGIQDSGNEAQDKEEVMITIDDIEEAQRDWALAVTDLGARKDDSPDALRQAAEEALDRLYAFDLTDVLFKPTRAVEQPFRSTTEGALSYFIAGDPDYSEDTGFALQPWVAVDFDNSGGIRIDGDTAVAMGRYTFTDDKEGTATVEYTFGYLKDSEGRLRIWLHHSSMPYGS